MTRKPSIAERDRPAWNLIADLAGLRGDDERLAIIRQAFAWQRRAQRREMLAKVRGLHNGFDLIDIDDVIRALGGRP